MFAKCRGIGRRRPAEHPELRGRLVLLRVWRGSRGRVFQGRCGHTWLLLRFSLRSDDFGAWNANNASRVAPNFQSALLDFPPDLACG